MPRDSGPPLVALSESPRDSVVLGQGDASVARSRTLPSTRTRRSSRASFGAVTPPARDENSEHRRRVLRKPQRDRDRASQLIAPAQAP